MLMCGGASPIVDLLLLLAIRKMPKRELNPTPLLGLDPESSASANSATSAVVW